MENILLLLFLHTTLNFKIDIEHLLINNNLTLVNK